MRLPTYSTYRPTGFDPAGAFLDDRQDWLVAPVIRTRDSGARERSNFAVVLKDLGDESDTVEIHRFGHWGPGWFEIILCAPESPAADKAQEWAGALENYPIADEMHLSELEWEEASAFWARASEKERRYWCERYGISKKAARRKSLPREEDGGHVSELVSSLAE